LPVETPKPVMACVSTRVTLPVVLNVTLGVAIVSEPIAPVLLVTEIDVGPLMVPEPVMVPEPLALIETVVELVAVALTAMLPFVPEAVCKTIALPLIALEVVMLPLPVSVNVPVDDVRIPEVPMVADAPVVVTEKLPPTVDAPRVTAPALETSAVALPPALTVKLVEAAVKIGVPDDPILPVPETKETVGAVTVTAPVRVIVPEPLAFKLTTPLAPVETLALIAIPELFPLVDRLTVAAPDVESAAPTVNVPPELTVIGLVVPEIAPRVVVDDAPLVVMDNDLAPREML